jgi:hypothetical protein
MSQSPIQFKIFIHTLDNSVIVNHELGIIDVPMKDLLAYPGLHPDLVEAAMTSVRELARKYNGVDYEKAVEQQIAGKGQPKADAAEAKLGPKDQSGNADEEAGQIATNNAALNQGAA